MFAEDKLFRGRIVRVLNLIVKIAKWMAWALLSYLIYNFYYIWALRLSLSELRLFLPTFNLHFCRFSALSVTFFPFS